MLGPEDRQPAADIIVLVSVGKEHRADEFYVIPRGDFYDFALHRHHAYWATRPDSRSGERALLGLRDSDADVKAFLEGYRDKWELVLEPAPRSPASSSR